MKLTVLCGQVVSPVLLPVIAAHPGNCLAMNSHECDCMHNYNNNYYYYTLFLPRGKVRPADKLQLKAAIILPLVGLARSKQDPVNRGHGAQYLYRPPPAGAMHIRVFFPSFERR